MTDHDLRREEVIPTIVSYSPTHHCFVVGREARKLGIEHHTNAHDFKMTIGSPPAEFETKTYWMDVGEPGKPEARTFSPREVSTIFLREVLKKCVGRYEKIMVGTPAIQNETWLEHYRSNIRNMLQEIGFAEPIFLPEPFAVFQFYRHVEKLIPEQNRSQIVLLVDIGGGTCNTCIVKTTAEGMISRGSLGSKPYGARAVDFGGKAIDIELLRVAVNMRSDLLRRWKDNVIERAKKSLSALVKIEDAKLKLCGDLSTKRNPSLQERVHVQFERGELDPDGEVRLDLSGADVRGVVRNAWTSRWLPAVTETIKEAERQLEAIDEIDKVILCGGSGQLPFLREFVASNLSKWVESIDDVIIGNTPEFSVAKGIEKECEIRAGKDPSLIANDLGRWASSSMYLGFRRNRVEEYTPVRVRNRPENPFLLVPEWTRLDGETLECEIELPFQPQDRLFFGVFDRPVDSKGTSVPLNIQQDTVRVPKGRFRETGKFLVKQTPEGALSCEIVLFRRTGQGSETAEHLKLPEFFPESLRIHSGKSLLGLDFGTSNTYLVEVNLAEENRQTDYFSFRIKPTVKDYLADLQTKLALAKDEGLLAKELLERDAFERRVDFVCHSVKLEGAELTRGETLEVLEKSKAPTSKGQREAKQLGEAYQWMLEHYEAFLEQAEGFARELNKKVLQGLNVEAGQYRTGSVKIRTREADYFPPDGPLVPMHMKGWGEYIRGENKGRSPLEFSAALHSIFVRIHPFADGNGRTARLLVNAYLLSQRLPIVVPTIDDRERYVDSLAESDNGNGDDFTLYLIELLQESVEGLQHPAKALAVNIDPDVDVSLEDEDPLADVMGKLIARDRLPATKVYEPWRATFEALRAEMDLLVNQFNQKYVGDGYEAKLIAYDILSEEKFSRLFLGLPTTKTWFFGLEVRTWRTKERFMFYFQHNLNFPPSGDEGCVVLRISRFDGNEYRNLTPDVFQPSEIAWRDGSVQFDWPEERHKAKPLRFQVSLLLAEIIRAFFQQPNELRAASSHVI